MLIAKAPVEPALFAKTGLNILGNVPYNSSLTADLPRQQIGCFLFFPKKEIDSQGIFALHWLENSDDYKGVFVWC